MKTYTLSNAQKRIWYAQKKYKNASLYNIGGTVKILGDTNPDILRAALLQLIQNNEALRLCFFEKDGQVYQYVSDHIYEVPFIDFTKEFDPTLAYKNWSQNCAQTPFIMTDQPLCYFAIAKISDWETAYFVKLHHIIADGWSMKLLTEQVAEYYTQIQNGNIPIDAQPSYLDYIAEEEQYLQSPRMKRDQIFWADMFSPLPAALPSESDDLHGRRKSFTVPASVQKNIEAYIKEKNISLNIFFTFLYFLYKYKSCGSTDIVIGMPLLGRSSRRKRQIFGTFTNTLPFRFAIHPYETAENVLFDLSKSLKKSYAHQKYPYNLLMQDLHCPQNGSERLFDTCINYYNTILQPTMAENEIVNVEFYNGQQDYGLQIIIRHWYGNDLQLDFDYQTALYSDAQIADIYQRLLLIAKQLLQNPTCKVQKLTLANEKEQQYCLIEYNQTKRPYPTDKTWLDLFADTVKAFPDRIAVSQGETQISYRLLFEQVSGFAAFLTDCGVRSGNIIAAILPHTENSIKAICAIMQCGATYLPIDKNNPPGRIKQILDSAQANILLADTCPADYTGKFISLEECSKNRNGTSVYAPAPEDTAYLIYTSGTTGAPKGVPIRHKNLMNYLCWAKNTYIQKDAETFALYSSFAFDFTMTSILLPLICGGEIRIYNPDEGNVFPDIIRENKVSILKITPSHIPLIPETAVSNTALHTFILGGENLISANAKILLGKFSGNVRICNEYGPTEATIGCMHYIYNPADTDPSVPIGKPISNTRIYLLDPDGKPVPPSMPGEIYISGVSVAGEYFQNDSETKQRFVPDPYSGGQMYKTEDLAFWNKSGNLVYLTRKDEEIKIRGNRVNLCEIENAALEDLTIQGAAAKVLEYQDSKQICLYIVANPRYRESSLRALLADKLPAYMIPQFILRLEKLPRSSNGKTDKARLPVPDASISTPAVFTDTKHLPVLLDALQTYIEESDITASSNYYALGGDSIKAIQISSKLNEQGYLLSVKEILQNPVIADMASYIKEAKQTALSENDCSGFIEPLPIQHWFSQQKLHDLGHYNQSVTLLLRQDISKDKLETALQKLISHHDILRANYDPKTHKLFYNPAHLSSSLHIEEIRTNYYPDNAIYQQINATFALEKDLLLRAYLIRTPAQTYLHLILHHLVTDGVSWRILLEDFTKLLTDPSLHLTNKAASYQTYAEKYAAFAARCNPDPRLWQNKSAPCFMLGTQNAVPYKKMKSLEFVLCTADTQKLMHTAAGKPNELLITALVRAVKKLYGINPICIDIEGHGRDVLPAADVSRTMGWFTNLYPICLHLDTDDLLTQIQEVQAQLKRYEGKEAEYGILRYIKNILSANEKHIRLNYLGEYTEADNECFTVHQLFCENDNNPDNTVPFLIDINAVVLSKKLHVHISYNEDFQKTIANFAACYKKTILEVAACMERH